MAVSKHDALRCYNVVFSTDDENNIFLFWALPKSFVFVNWLVCVYLENLQRCGAGTIWQCPDSGSGYRYKKAPAPPW